MNYTIKIYKKLLLCFSFYIIFLYILKYKSFINQIHISISLDENYIYTCIVYLTSLLDNRYNSTFYIIHILTDNSITNEYMKKISQIAKKFGKNHVRLKFYNLEGDFKGATNKSFPLTAYYRISLPSLLTNIDKIIYSDLDGIIFDDLSEMYSIKFKEQMYFCGSLDYFHMVHEIEKFGIKINKYINSGFLLINLKAIRDDGIEKKLRDFVSTHELPMADQTAINAVCNNNIQILSYKYSLFALDSFKQLVYLNKNQDIIYRLNDSELKKAFNEPIFLHYFDGTKPFKKYNFKPKFNRVYWWYYAKMSGFYKEIIDFYKFDINDIEKLINQIPEDGGLLRRNFKKLISINNV